jgi:hypothetical protein
VTLAAWELLSVLLVPALLGAALLRLQGVAPRTDPLAFGGWAWLQGSLALAMVLSLWLWLELPLRAAWILPALLALTAALYGLGRRVEVMAPSTEARHPAWERLLFGLTLAFLLLTLLDRILLAASDVVATSDEARIWASKAKVLFHTGGFGAGFRAALAEPEVISHPDYPPLSPLLQVWVHAHAGEIVHVESRLPIQAFGIAGLLLAASALLRRARPLVATPFLACIGTLGFARFSMGQAFSDVLIATGLLACWDLWQRFEEDGRRVWLRVLCACAPALLWSKNEGLLHVLAFGVAFSFAACFRRTRLPQRRGLRAALAGTLPLLGSIVYLQWFNRHFELSNDLVRSTAEHLGTDRGGLAAFVEHAAGNVRPILASFAAQIGATPRTRFLLLAFLVLTASSPRVAFGKGRLAFTLGLLLALLGYMAVYLWSPWRDVEVHLKHSVHRLVYHLLPSAGLWLLLYVVHVLPRLAADARASGPVQSSSA